MLRCLVIPVQRCDFDRISPTALITAYARQFTDIPYTQELSAMVHAQAFVDQILYQPSARPMALVTLIEGRYKAINQTLSQFKPTQVLELASGLSPRGLIMSQDPGITFVESDLPAVIGHKQKLVNRLIGDRPNLHFVAIEVASQSNQLQASLSCLDLQKPVIILCEGLLMYLTFAQKQQAFAYVRELLQTYGGVWLTTDLATKEDWSLKWRSDLTMQRFTQIISQLTQTTVSDTTFNNFEHVKQFANQQGFQIEKMSVPSVLNQLSCLEPLGIAVKTAKSLLSGLSVSALTLKDEMPESGTMLAI